MKTNMNCLPPEAVNPDLLTLCPKMGEEGKVVTWRGKRYWLSRVRGFGIFVKRFKE